VGDMCCMCGVYVVCVCDIYVYVGVWCVWYVCDVCVCVVFCMTTELFMESG